MWEGGVSDTKRDKGKEIRERISQAILKYLVHTDAPLTNVVEYVVHDQRITKDLLLISEAINSLLDSGVIVISGICPHMFCKRELDVRIRRASDFLGGIPYNRPKGGPRDFISEYTMG